MNRSEKLTSIVQSRDGINMTMHDTSNIRLNIIYSTLKHRGIEDRSNFINPTNFIKTPIKSIHNIDEMLLLEEAIKAGKSVGVLVDVDCDGMTSGAMLINYFNDNYENANIHPIFPKMKLHGVEKNLDTIMEAHEEYNFDYIILPDSSSNDLSTIHKLINDGINVLVIDHHDLNLNVIDENPKFIINNQSAYNDEHVNKNFTGVGMVYECLKYLDQRNGTQYADGYLDLFAIGQIADVSDISDLEVRSLMLRGFNAVNNPLIDRFVKTNHTKLTPKALQFSIIPMINAVNRVGSVEDKNTLFKALIKDDNSDYQISKRRNVNHHFVYEDVDVDIYDYIINRMTKIKGEQKKMVNRALKDAVYLSDENDNFNLIEIGNENGGITGLIGNQILGDTGKATFIVHKVKDNYIGSMRIPMAYTDTLERLESSFAQLGNLNYAQGHENAAGISFNLSDEFIQPTLDILNSLFIPVKNTYEVDDYFINNTPSLLTCRTVDEMEHCFGGKVKEPVIGILGLNVFPSNFNINKKTLHININGIDFVKFNLTDEEIESIDDHLDTTDDIYVDMVGSVGINRFLGKTTPQFIMSDLEFTTGITNEDNDDLVF